jgi:hypothetical protein
MIKEPNILQKRILKKLEHKKLRLGKKYEESRKNEAHYLDKYNKELLFQGEINNIAQETGACINNLKTALSKQSSGSEHANVRPQVS